MGGGGEVGGGDVGGGGAIFFKKKNKRKNILSKYILMQAFNLYHSQFNRRQMDDILFFVENRI